MVNGELAKWVVGKMGNTNLGKMGIGKNDVGKMVNRRNGNIL
jgi:hypothetical protein